MDSKLLSFTCNHDLSFSLPIPNRLAKNTSMHTVSRHHHGYFVAVYMPSIGNLLPFVAFYGYFAHPSASLISIILHNPCVQKIGGRSIHQNARPDGKTAQPVGHRYRLSDRSTRGGSASPICWGSCRVWTWPLKKKTSPAFGNTGTGCISESGTVTSVKLSLISALVVHKTGGVCPPGTTCLTQITIGPTILL